MSEISNLARIVARKEAISAQREKRANIYARLGKLLMGTKAWKPAKYVSPLALSPARVGPLTSSLPDLAKGIGAATLRGGDRAAKFIRPGTEPFAAAAGETQGLMRTLGRASALGAGGMAAKDLATLPFGGWANKDRSGGMRQGGLDYQRQAINPFNAGPAQAALSTMFSPVKSVASLGFGDSDAPGVSTRRKLVSQRGPLKTYRDTPYAVGPREKKWTQKYDAGTKKYNQMQADYQSEIDKATEAGPGPYRSQGEGDLPVKAQDKIRDIYHKADLARMKQNLESGEHGGTPGGWFTGKSDSAAEVKQKIDELTDLLQGVGLPTPGSSPPSRSRSSRTPDEVAAAYAARNLPF